MYIEKRYCDCCLKEIDTRQKPSMHSNGDNREFIILRRNKYQSKIVSEVVVKTSLSDDDLFNNIDLCDRCYDKIATYLYSMMNAGLIKKEKENETSDLDNDYQPEFKKWNDFI